MKKLFFCSKKLTLLFLFAIFLLQAQTVSTDYATQINSTFANLDKTKVLHKLLIDYAMEFAELSAYNGTITNDNVVHRGTYTEIYNTLLMARTQSNVTGLVNPTTFRTNWDNLRQANKVVLSGLYYKYNQFKTNASPNFVTITNNKLYDKYIGGVWQNPYDEKQVFAMTAPLLKYNSLTMQVQLPTSLWYTNQASSVLNIAIDFSDGLGYQTIVVDQLKTVTYAQPGVKEWRYKLTLTNNQVLYSHSKIQIDAEVPPTNTTTIAYRTINQSCSVNAFGIDQVEFSGTRQYLGQNNSATLEIDYAGTNGCSTIKKPLIVVEGFDSGLLGIENTLGEVDYLKFRRSASTLFSGSVDLPSQLNTYDIIYINFKNGKDYLQRNAYLVEDIIKWVNQQKALAGSTQQNVVLGQSMGGVIARYALRDMENQFTNTSLPSWQHQTSLYISHDAPQQGANIPLSILYFARHLGDQFISTPLGDININPNDGAPVTIEDIQNLLSAAGTKQLLMNNVATNFSIDNTFSSAWQTELRSLGYPLQTRNIAISNGNHCANPQEFSPASTLFSLSGFGKTSYLTSFLTELLGPLNAINDIGSIGLAILFNEPGLLIGILPGNSKFNLDFDAKALPNVGTTTQIYKGKITFTKKLFWLFNITVTLTNRSYNNPTGILAYDYYPGGKYPVPFDFHNSAVSNAFISFGISAQIADNFNFIPTPSALDIGKGIVILNDNDYLAKYNAVSPPIAPKNTPFANFTTSYNEGSNLNENHISFNVKNGNWLAKEIDNIPYNNDTFNCSYMCSDQQILGSNIICSTSSYSAPVEGTYYNWSVTQSTNLVTLAGNGTNSIVLNRVSSTTSGQITLNLYFGNPTCGYKNITKTIWVGSPDFYLDIFPTPQQPEKTFVTLTSNNPMVPIEQQVITSTSITKVSNTGSIVDIKWAGQMFVGKMDPNLTNSVTATATNACGTTTVTVNLLELLNKQADPKNTNLYKIYPNPSNNLINIDLIDKNKKTYENTKIIAELYDFSGQSKQKVEVINNTASISCSGLLKGIYILRIRIDGNVESHQVFVQ